MAKKKVYDYVCIRCGKKKKSVVYDQIVCSKCSKWSMPGKGQTDIYGGVVKK
jgi:predicted ATP-dependent serine protease